MDVDRDEALEVAARVEAWSRREAVRALAREPLPERLRLALVELGAMGRRLHLAVEAYRARVGRMMADPEERDLPALACRAWPEHAERAAAREAYEETKQLVAEMAVAWVKGPAPGSGS